MSATYLAMLEQVLENQITIMHALQCCVAQDRPELLDELSDGRKASAALIDGEDAVYWDGLSPRI